ncbi:MAG: (d)CMP kinase [Coriobacteriia bacterium]|nr:(d)CMP kinase [Coriobacteriia bacterium]
MIIAIDGPAGSGKSTIAKMVAQILGFRYLDTGAMYRAVAVRARDLEVSYDDSEALCELAERDAIEFGFNENESLPSRIFIAGKEVTDEIRCAQIDKAVSPVSAHQAVREALVAQQRELGRRDDYVVEGRDIGTVVFPDAEVKVFLTAGAEERARRRAAQNREREIDFDYDRILADIIRRDDYDTNRLHSPLMAAEDAHLIDSTIMTIDHVTNTIVDLARAVDGLE